MSWKFEPAARSFENHRIDWDALNHSRGGHILLDSGFVGPALKHFSDGEVIFGHDENSSGSGAALFVSRGKGRWETFQPSQVPIGLLLFNSADTNGQALQRLTRSLPGFAIQLSVLQQDPDYTSVPVAEGQAGLERLEYIQTARITINGTFEEYWKQRNGKFRYNLSRRRRRMAENNLTGELKAIRSVADIAGAIAEYGRLESAGWKAENGTAISADNAQGRFYREVFEYFAERGEAVVYQFLIDGKVVASDLCLVRNGMMILLKTAYDEAMNEYSPALMMREDIMKEIFSGGQVRVVEFYGRVMEWHTRWSEESRALYHVNCLRAPWVASLKKIAGRFK